MKSFDCHLFFIYVQTVVISTLSLPAVDFCVAALLCKFTHALPSETVLFTRSFCSHDKCFVCLRLMCWWTMPDGHRGRGWLTRHFKLIVSWSTWMWLDQCLWPSVSCHTWWLDVMAISSSLAVLLARCVSHVVYSVYRVVMTIDNDNDNDVYFTLATSDSRIGKYKTENNWHIKTEVGL